MAEFTPEGSRKLAWRAVDDGVKGDGRGYQACFSTDAEYRGREMSFQAGFPTTKGGWTKVKIPFTQFTGIWRGIELPDKIFDSAKIRRIGLQLADI